MRKIIFILLTFGINHAGFSQNKLFSAIHHYYRYDPFERSFSSFINNLVTDPVLKNKTIVKRTDSTLFFFKGEYSAHNPFGFKASHTEVRLAEMQVQNPDSAAVADTILVYQLLGYCNTSANGTESVKKEFEKFDRKYGNEFENKTTKELQEENKPVGNIRNYFLSYAAISPLTVSWITINAGESVFAITIRFIKIENEALLPSINARILSPLSQ